MSKLSQHQLRQMLCSLTRRPRDERWGASDQSMEDDLAQVYGENLINIPVDDVNQVSVLPDRLAVLTDINGKRKSVLAQYLFDRNDETVLVADSYLSGKDALFFVCLVPFNGISMIGDWVSKMRSELVSLTIRPIDENTLIMAASLQSFVSGEST